MTARPLITGFALGPTADIIERYGGWRAVEGAFRAAELPLQVIEQRSLFIPFEAQATLMEHAARQLGEAKLSIYIGLEFPISDLGIYGRYTAMAPTLRAALARAVKGLGYLTNSANLGMEIHTNEIRITYDSGIQGAPGARHIHTATVLIIIDLIRRFAGARWNPIRIELDYPKDADTKDLEEIFRAPVIFNCRFPAIVFEPHLLDQPNTRTFFARNQLTFGDLRQMVQSKPQNDLQSAVEAVLRLRLLEGQTDIEGTAQSLDIGPRTLQRRLQSEGASYRGLVENIRQERASALLVETSERVTDIAVALGYSSPGHFVRAFRRWTGNTPDAFRQRQI